MKGLVLALLFLGNVAMAQQTDTEVITGICNGMLQEISGAKGKVRNWDKVRAWFLPAATLTYQSGKGVGHLPASFLWTKADSIYKARDFYETPADVQVQISSTVATAHQRYSTEINGKPGHRGHNVYTLIKTAEGWRIDHLAWYQE